jgi:chemotaxis response regulator CheB
MNIIIVDDDPLVVESLKTIIGSSGIEILDTGLDGNEAVYLYFKYNPD